MGSFCLVLLILINPPVEIGEIIGVLANACPGFGGPCPTFYGAVGKELQFWQIFWQGLELAAYYSTSGRNMENRKQ